MNFLTGILAVFAITVVFLVNPLVASALAGDIFLFDDFNDGNFNGWVVESGNWYVTNGYLVGSKSGRAYSGKIYTGNSDWDNYRLEADVNGFGGIDQGIGVRYSQSGSYGVNLRYGTGIYDTPQIKLWKEVGNQGILLAYTHSFPLINNKWYHVKVEVFNEDIKVWIDNTLIFDYKDAGTDVKKGAPVLSYWTGDVGVANMRFDNVKVTALEPQSTPSPAPEPFLDLPWDYGEKGLSFNEAAQAMTAYFDHTYPLLSRSITEQSSYLNQITTYENENSTTKNYSSHDGYDYAKYAKVNINDPVLAAADGVATLGDKTKCGACGNYLLIDHNNYYQTRYYHLMNDSLIVTKPDQKAEVKKGQQIAKVGATGNVSPPGDAGAHIHFMVVQDKNKDGNFDDNIPDGVTDPFGWQSKDSDPWENYTFFYNGQNRTGNKSFYLWTKKLDNLDSTLASNGGIFKTSRATLNFPAGATNQNLSINIQSSPIVKVGNSLSSIGSTIVATARDLLGNTVTQFQKSFIVTIDFSSFDLSRYKTDTIFIYSSQDGINWDKIPTIVDFGNMSATAGANHFTYFALMAERLDTISPVTTADLAGNQGQTNWFRSDVQVSLNAADNEGGLGIDYTLYRSEGSDWAVYSTPLVFATEGRHKIEFYSADQDENLEDIKSIEFTIDRTFPEASIDANPKSLWPPNGKMVDVNMTGESFDTYLKSTNIIINDEYHQVEPQVSNFGQTIQLEAKRDGGDLDGRVYIIKVIAEDLAGNITEREVQVIVPHDQGKKR